MSSIGNTTTPSARKLQAIAALGIVAGAFYYVWDRRRNNQSNNNTNIVIGNNNAEEEKPQTLGERGRSLLIRCFKIGKAIMFHSNSNSNYDLQ